MKLKYVRNVWNSISYLVQQNTTKLLYNNMHLVSCSCHGQECEHHLTGSSAQGFTKLHSRYQQSSCVFSYKVWLPISCDHWQNPVPLVDRTEVVFSCCMLAGTALRFSRSPANSLPHDPLPLAPSYQYGGLIFQDQQKNLLLQSAKVKCYIM